MKMAEQIAVLASRHCVRGVRICSFTSLYFPAFGQNTEICRANSVFSPNAWNMDHKKPQIQTVFIQFSSSSKWTEITKKFEKI